MALRYHENGSNSTPNRLSLCPNFLSAGGCGMATSVLTPNNWRRNVERSHKVERTQSDISGFARHFLCLREIAD